MPQHSRPGSVLKKRDVHSRASDCRLSPPLSLARAPTRATCANSAWSSRPNTARVQSRERNETEAGYSLEKLPVARPLRLENQSAELIEDLERLSGRRPKVALAEEIIHKANGRLEDFLSCESPKNAKQLSRRFSELQDSEQLHSKFSELVRKIDQAFSGGSVALPAVTLRPGSVLEEALDAKSTLAVTIPLPRRRVEVVVGLARLSGAASDLRVYGSDVEPPSSNNYELEEEGGELCYRHDPDLGARASGVAAVRTALFLSVEADQPASFRLRVTLRRIQDAQYGSLQTACKRVEQRLALLRGDAMQKHQFEERLKEAKEHLHGKPTAKNFRKINRARVQDWEEGAARHARLVKQTLRMGLAEQRREALEEEREERMVWWVEKHQLRKFEKEEQERLRHEAFLMEERRAEWMAKLLLVSFTVRLFTKVKGQQKFREAAKKEALACLKIQLWVRRNLSRFRRRKLYSNVLKMRLAVTSFVRQAKMGAKFIGHDRALWFLNVHLCSQENLSFADLVKKYVAAVRRVQRAFRRNLTIRRAHVEVLMAHFTAEHLVKAELAKLLKMALREPRPPEKPKEKEKEKKRGDRKAASAPKASAKASAAASAAANAAANAAATAAPSFRLRRRNAVVVDPSKLIPDLAAGWVKEYKMGKEVIPHYIRSYVVQKHVREMHQSYCQRYADWQRRKQELAVDIDLNKMTGVGDTDKLREIEVVPMKVEVSRIRDLYDETYNTYIKNGFKSLTHSVRRQWRKVLHGWRRVAMWGLFHDEQDDVGPHALLAWGRESVGPALGSASSPVQRLRAKSPGPPPSAQRWP